LGNLIVADEQGIQIQCYAHGYKKENLVCHSIVLKHGDLLTITNRKKYIVDVGWFVLVKINHHKEEFMFVQDLEESVGNGKMMDEIDCMLNLLSTSYYLDQALAHKNKEEFLKYSSIRNRISILFERLCEKVYIEA